MFRQQLYVSSGTGVLIFVPYRDICCTCLGVPLAKEVQNRAGRVYATRRAGPGQHCGTADGCQMCSNGKASETQAEGRIQEVLCRRFELKGKLCGKLVELELTACFVSRTWAANRAGASRTSVVDMRSMEWTQCAANATGWLKSTASHQAVLVDSGTMFGRCRQLETKHDVSSCVSLHCNIKNSRSDVCGYMRWEPTMPFICTCMYVCAWGGVLLNSIVFTAPVLCSVIIRFIEFLYLESLLNLQNVLNTNYQFLLTY